MIQTNADDSELAKFSALAHRWWDPQSEFRPLHEINPLRLDWIDAASPISGKAVIDIGCGGGILAESMAQRGAKVTGIDLSDKALAVARLHALDSGVSVDYQKIAAETIAAERPGQFEVVSCMEMLEHVPDPASTVRACADLAAPGASVYFSTINRNAKAYLMAIIGAEYLLRMLPRGTHEYQRFIKPAELTRFARDAGLDVVELIGMHYNPLDKRYSLGAGTDVNYLMRCVKHA
ncbi:bifunctional 3-demethylubiquinone 3-O-methyltransferase/2-octaprenyl-6-hydroxy phenol methylase [Uliginosibacterium sediminicola]